MALTSRYADLTALTFLDVVSSLIKKSSCEHLVFTKTCIYDHKHGSNRIRTSVDVVGSDSFCQNNGY